MPLLSTNRNEKQLTHLSIDTKHTTAVADERHASDHGIYTIHMHKSITTNSAPIKLKRPTTMVSSY
jgi:hypothetical protein